MIKVELELLAAYLKCCGFTVNFLCLFYQKLVFRWRFVEWYLKVVSIQWNNAAFSKAYHADLHVNQNLRRLYREQCEIIFE